MTDDRKPESTEAPQAHLFLLWARKIALNPTVILTARLTLGAVAVGLGAAFTYVVGIDSKANAIDHKVESLRVLVDTNRLTNEKAFDVLTTKLEAQGVRMGIDRDDRLRFQEQVLTALDQIVKGQSQSNAEAAAQNERIKAIVDRLSRIEPKDR